MERNDFVVDSEGCCFLCLRGSAVQPESLPGSLTYSVQSLSRYLNMDIGKVLKQKGVTTLPHVLTRVDNSILKVELCEECGNLSKTFSELSGKMEKIEMEMALCLRRIQRKMLMCKLVGSRSDLVGESSEKFKIVDALRMEAMQKCFRKLTTAQPRVRVQNLSGRLVNADMIRKCKWKPKIANKSELKPVCRPTNKTALSSDIEICQVKIQPTEAPTKDLMSEYTENGDCLPFPSHNSSSTVLERGNKRAPQLEECYTDVKVHKETPHRNSYRNSPKKVRVHHKLKPGRGRYVCKFCSREFSTNGKLQIHLQSVHLIVKNKCDKCGKQFSRESNCVRHYQTVHQNVRYNCTVCGQKFTQQYSLNRHHRDMHTTTPSFTCNECNDGFKRKTNLIRHLQTTKCKSGYVKHTSFSV